jgi:RNA polymerase sigma-70 factor (sigma-E family)
MSPSTQQSFREFVEERLDPLLRYATVLCCDPHLAQDVVQASLLRAQERWARIAAMEAPAAYVKKMVTNEYLGWRRRRASREIAVSLQVLDDIGRPSADTTSRYDERAAMLAKVARLPPKQRAAIVLHFYEGYSYDEIASTLSCRAGTVRGYVSRALSTLRADEPDQSPVRSRS